MLKLVWKHERMSWPLEGRRAAHCRAVDGCRGHGRDLGGTLSQIQFGYTRLTFLQFLIIAVPTRRESWLHKIAPEQISDFIAREEHGNTGERRRINYLPDTNRYSDRVEEAEDDAAAPLSPETRRALEEGHARVGTGLPGNIALDAPATEEWARG